MRDLMEDKIKDEVNRLQHEIYESGGLLNEVKSQSDSAFSQMKRSNADMLVIQKTITTNLQKLNLDHQMVERDVGLTRVAMQQLLYQAELVDSIL